MAKDEQKYLDDLDQMVEEAAGGGGLICEGAVFGAFNVFAGGVSPADRTFLYTTSAEKSKVRKKAQDAADQYGCNMMDTLMLVLYKESVLGRDVGHWKDDRYHDYGPMWGPDVKEAFYPRKVELRLIAGKRTWMRVGSMPSPNAEANPDKDWATETVDGEERLKHILIPVAVFGAGKDGKAKAEEAAEALGTVEAAVNDPSYPGEAHGWKNYDDWVSVKPEIYESFQEYVPEFLEELKEDKEWKDKKVKTRKKEAERLAIEQLAEDYPSSEEQIKFVLAEAVMGK